MARAATRAEHAAAMQCGERERTPQGIALEILGGMALDHPQGTRVTGEDGGLREHTVHDEPLALAERAGVALPQRLLQRNAGPLHRAPRCLERGPRLPRRAAFQWHIHELQAARFERCAHAGPQRRDRRGVEFTGPLPSLARRT